MQQGAHLLMLCTCSTLRPCAPAPGIPHSDFALPNHVCADKADDLWEMSAASAQNGKVLGINTCLGLADSHCK